MVSDDVVGEPALRKTSRLSFVQTQRGVIRLTLLIGAVLIGLAAIWASVARQVAVEQTEIEVRNLSRSIAELTHDLLQDADTILLGLRERVQEDGTDASNRARLSRLMAGEAAARPLIHALLIIGPDGSLLASSVPLPEAGLNYSDRAYFRQAMQSHDDAPCFGDPIRSKLDGTWIVTVSRKLTTRDGRFDGVVLATIALTYFQQSFDSFDVGEHGAITLATTDGALVSRRPFLPPNVGRSIATSAMFKQINTPGASDSLSYVAQIDGQARIGAYHRVEGFPLFVIVARARDQALAGWRRQSETLVGEVVCVLLALAWITHRLVSQVGHLRQAEMQLQGAHRRLLRSKARMAEGNHWLLLAEEIGHVGHWRLTLPDCRLSWSAEVFRICALPPAAGIDLDAAIAVYHPDDREAVREAVDASLSEGVALEISARIVRPDGEIRHVTSRGALQHDPDGRPISLFGVCLDQTEQRRIETDLRSAQRDTEAANARLNQLARQDGLTGLFNRRHFDEMLDAEYRRGARTSTPLSLIMLDVDHFKAFNDRYGHPEGDRCLQAIAAILEAAPHRPADLAARYGGEELALLLPDTDIIGAYGLATRVVDEVRALQIPHHGSPKGVVTISAGVQSVIPDPERLAAETLLVEADRALYAAKCGGRGRAAMLEASTAAVDVATLCVSP